MRGDARLRRHPYPLRRPAVLGPHVVDLALARRHERRDRKLRIRHRTDAPRAPRSDPAHARERRGHVARRAARGSRQRLAVRDLPPVPGRARCARHRDPRGCAGRAHARAPLRDGRGRHRARGDARRNRADAGDRARCARRGRGRLRDFARAHACRLCGEAGAEPRRGFRRGHGARELSRRVRPRTHAGDRRARSVHPAARRDLAGNRKDCELDRAARGPVRTRWAPPRARDEREAPGSGHRRGAAGLVPAARARVPVRGAVPVREHVGVLARLRSRPRGQEAHLRRSRLARAVPRARERGDAHSQLGRDGDQRVPWRACARGAQCRRGRGRARCRSDRPDARSRARERPRGALPDAHRQYRRSRGRGAAPQSEHRTRTLRRGRPCQPALRRLRTDPPARALGARDERALARGGRAPAHVGHRRPLWPARPRPPRSRGARRRRDLRSRHGRMWTAAARARLPRRRRSPGLGRDRHSRCRGGGHADSRGRARRRRSRRTAARSRASRRTRKGVS